MYGGHKVGRSHHCSRGFLTEGEQVSPKSWNHLEASGARQVHSTWRQVGLRVPTCPLRARLILNKGSCAMQCSQVTYHRSAESRNSKLRGLQSFIGNLPGKGPQAPPTLRCASLCSLPLWFGAPDPTSWPLGSKVQVGEGVTWPLEAPHHVRQEGRPGGKVLWIWEDPGFL